MKNLYLISLYFFTISLAFSSDNNGRLSNNTDSKSHLLSAGNDNASVSMNVASPIDIEKIKQSRLAKGKVEKIKSQQVLNKQKNGVVDKSQMLNPNIELIGKELKTKQMFSQSMGKNMFEKFFRKIEKKYITRSVGDNDSDKKIKFPVKTESN